jgi:hypothetical protein
MIDVFFSDQPISHPPCVWDTLDVGNFVYIPQKLKLKECILKNGQDVKIIVIKKEF